MKDEGTTLIVGTSIADQKASLNEIPGSVGSHKHPDVMPIKDKLLQGGNIK